MKYSLNKNPGECVSLPVLVLDRLQQAPEEGVRVALFVLKTQVGEAPAIAASLGIQVDAAAAALEFWAAAGLLVPEDAPAPPPPRAMVSLNEVVYASRHDPSVAGLIDHAQSITGGPLSPTDTRVLGSLHLDDGLAVDFILAGLDHFHGEGLGVRAAARRLRTLADKGVDTLEAFELHMKQMALRAEREALTAQLLGLPLDGLTAAQKNTIAVWYERYGFNDAMVEAGALRCGVNRTVKYLNGILRNWHGTGIQQVGDIPDAPANIAPTAPVKDPKDDFFARIGYRVDFSALPDDNDDDTP